MKKMLMVLIMALGIAGFFPLSANATGYVDEAIPTFTEVIFKADVPNGFEQNVVVSVVDGGGKLNTVLYEKDDYVSSMHIVSGFEYGLDVVIRQGDYETDIDKTFFADGETMEISFTVTEANIYKPLPNDGNIADIDPTHGEEDIDELTGLPTAESVFEHCKEVFSVMENNPDFESYLKTWSSQMIKQVFLDAKEDNTEEKWNAMTPTERFMQYIISTLPQIEMTNNIYKNENDFVNEISYMKDRLADIEGGEAVYNEIEYVWRWIYKYYLHTGTFYDFYEEYDSIYAGTSLSGESSSSDKDKEEAAEILQELEDEGALDEVMEIVEQDTETEDNSNTFMDWVKGNIFTLIIFIGVLIGFIVFYIKTKKKEAEKRF